MLLNVAEALLNFDKILEEFAENVANFCAKSNNVAAVHKGLRPETFLKSKDALFEQSRLRPDSLRANVAMLWTCAKAREVVFGCARNRT